MMKCIRIVIIGTLTSRGAPPDSSPISTGLCSTVEPGVLGHENLFFLQKQFVGKAEQELVRAISSLK